jgi:hypothetical protein
VAANILWTLELEWQARTVSPCTRVRYLHVACLVAALVLRTIACELRAEPAAERACGPTGVLSWKYMASPLLWVVGYCAWNHLLLNETRAEFSWGMRWLHVEAPFLAIAVHRRWQCRESRESGGACVETWSSQWLPGRALTLGCFLLVPDLAAIFPPFRPCMPELLSRTSPCTVWSHAAAWVTAAVLAVDLIHAVGEVAGWTEHRQSNRSHTRAHKVD